MYSTDPKSQEFFVKNVNSEPNVPDLPDLFGADGVFYSPNEVLVKFFTEQELQMI